MALGAGASDRSEAGRTRELRAEWEGEFVARVAAFAAARGGTLNTVLQGAFGLVLSRYLGVPDLAFAAIRAARHWAGEEHGREVGLFMNSLPVRCRFEPGATVSEWLRELRRQHLEIRPHEHTPAELIPGWLDLPAGTPLVEAGFRYERGDFTDSLRRALGSETGIRVGIRERAGMPLFLSAEGEVELSLTLEYDPARCVPALAARFLGHVRSACEAMLAAPDGEMFRLPLPALPGERRQSPPLPGWGGEPPVSVLGELATLAAGRPDAVAVEDVAVRMTYAELWRRAGALAAVLGRRGVNRGDVVALSTERRPYAVASLVGIFRSGAAVLQIDATLPAERQRFMIEDAGVRVLVTDAATAPGLASLGLETVLVGEGAPEESGAAFASGTEPGPDDASYLIYTSGTTGKPKGVINTHRGLANETRAAAHLFRLGPGDRMLHMANLSFDAAFEEIFATLLAGGDAGMPSGRRHGLDGAVPSGGERAGHHGARPDDGTVGPVGVVDGSRARGVAGRTPRAGRGWREDAGEHLRHLEATEPGPGPVG
jgi:non-ribosomal peptide synthetase component F